MLWAARLRLTANATHDWTTDDVVRVRPSDHRRLNLSVRRYLGYAIGAATAAASLSFSLALHPRLEASSGQPECPQQKLSTGH